ncbi:hypothetical protein RCF27_09440 [Rhodococcus pyridinivorans]|uniref:hypothetical protein n=1 Tax=Rhodococcus pyridinivorans TaxID=103816 RepID=UPI00280A578E|nr:hypothetical protein [Rhodococcus pyridinivorans]WMM74481.1 hypothetical protein RCF27_09440 [Rhodococcus pyridinivorans]
MSDREAPVKRYELEAVIEDLTRFVEQSAKDRQLDREQAAKDSADIKELLKENNSIMREAMAELRAEVRNDYVTKKDLTIRLSPHEPIRKFFWWVAGGMGVMFLATVYQLLINGVKTL